MGVAGRRLAYLACPTTLTGSPVRRPDAFEHDREFQPLKAAFDAAGARLEEQDWRTLTAQAAEAYDLLLVRTTWDYQEAPGDFAAFLDAMPAEKLANPADLIRWNMDKRYLIALAACGLPVIPTMLADQPAPALFKALGTDKIVVKPRIGAGGEGQQVLTPDSAASFAPDAGLIAQPFLDAVLVEGEYSFVYLNGQYSHAVRKTSGGDYRIQSLYGGQDRPHDPKPADRAAADAFIDALPFPGLTVRVDMIRGADGGLKLIELEAVEPYLYPVGEPAFGPRFVAAVEDWLAGRRVGQGLAPPAARR